MKYTKAENHSSDYDLFFFGKTCMDKCSLWLNRLFSNLTLSIYVYTIHMYTYTYVSFVQRDR